MSTQESSSGLTKWQLALLIGAPVAAACVIGAVWYMRSSCNKTDPESEENVKQKKNESAASEEKSTADENMASIKRRTRSAEHQNIGHLFTSY